MRLLFYLSLIYILILNITGFAIMGIDKSRAKNNKWRVKEKTLFLIAAVGGSLGSIFGMQYFRHKTKHQSFVIGMPLILIFQVVVIIFIINQI